jgi:ABC-2 type transport system permease protein
LASILIHYSLIFLLTSVAFWTVRAQGIIWGYYSLFNVARLPDAAFRGFFKAFFTFAIPMLLVANVPAKLLLNTLQSPGSMLLLVGMGGGCFVLSELFWRFSLRRYTSASA